MPHFLHAGPVQVRYENGFLRYFTVDNAEIIRMIYFAIRDQHWSTIAFTVTDEEISQTDTSFRIQYNWRTNDLSIQMMGSMTIVGEENGTVTVEFYGKAINTFHKNRIGLCLLHPIDGTLGHPVQLEAPDGTVTDTHFPTFISPHQPFLNIQTLRWRPASGTTWQLDFSGDVFETEDQRNWTDASFKTYSTPLSVPFPADVMRGDTFSQRIVFRAAEQPIEAPVASDKMGAMDQVKAAIKPTKPRIGVGHPAGGPPLTDTEVKLLRPLHLAHLRTDVFFSLADWQGLLAVALDDALQLQTPLELALFFGNDSANELKALLEFWPSQASTVGVGYVLVFNAATLKTSDELLRTVGPAIRRAWPEAALGGGTDDNFAELNRNPFDFTLVDFVSFSISPQVHAFDDLTLLENIAGQVETVVSARQLTGGKPIHISPITLKLRYITMAGTATERQNAPADGRQATDFGANWTRQSLEALGSAGVESVTYYQTHGPAGVVNGGSAHPLLASLTTP